MENIWTRNAQSLIDESFFLRKFDIERSNSRSAQWQKQMLKLNKQEISMNGENDTHNEEQEWQNKTKNLF